MINYQVYIWQAFIFTIIRREPLGAVKYDEIEKNARKKSKRRYVCRKGSAIIINVDYALGAIMTVTRERDIFLLSLPRLFRGRFARPRESRSAVRPAYLHSYRPAEY